MDARRAQVIELCSLEGVEEMAGGLNVLRETVVVTGRRAGLRLDSPGKTTMVEKPIDVQQTALRGSLEVFDLAHPAGQWVPSGENLGHQSLTCERSNLRTLRTLR